MNRTEFITIVAEKAKITYERASEFVDIFSDVVINTLATGEKVTLTGFGTFEVRDRAERHAKNPRTGEDIIVPGQKSAAFKAGKFMSDAVKLEIT